MNRLDRTIVSQLNTAVQGFLGRRATLQILLCLACISLCAQQPSSQDAGWKGELHNASGNPIGGAIIELKSPKGSVTARPPRTAASPFTNSATFVTRFMSP